MRAKKLVTTAVVFLLSGVFVAAFLYEPKSGSPPPTQPGVIAGETLAADGIAAARVGEALQSGLAAPTPPSLATSPPATRRPEEVRPLARSIDPRQRTVTYNDIEYPARIYKTLLSPNDTYGTQWWTTQAGLNTMWDTARGPHSTVLAVIDTGFALQHEEFSDRWALNSGEAGAAASENASALNCTDQGRGLNANCNLIDDDGDGIVDEESWTTTAENPSRLNCTDQGRAIAKDCNRQDDDGNGYVDDYNGWDFINYDNSSQAGEIEPLGSGTSHGTQVAGIAAATGNNSKGLAGVDWGTKILPIQAIDDESYGDTLSVARSIDYARIRGADVISISLGSDDPDPLVEEAVRNAIRAGIIVVAAAGNDGCDCMVYPARYPEVVAVGALNSSSAAASFSSWGSNLDIMAPGTNMASSTWRSSNQTSSYSTGLNGTSFAAPLVGGMMTRLLSHQPNATPLQLLAAIKETANRLTLPPLVPHDTRLGHGTVSASAATARMTTPLTLPFYALTPVSRGNALPLPISDVAGSYNALQCPETTVGGTALYEMLKNGLRYYSISPQEVERSRVQGYSVSLFSYVCLQQPHDASENIRNIDVFTEFKNYYKKP